MTFARDYELALKIVTFAREYQLASKKRAIFRSARAFGRNSRRRFARARATCVALACNLGLAVTNCDIDDANCDMYHACCDITGANCDAADAGIARLLKPDMFGNIIVVTQVKFPNPDP